MEAVNVSDLAISISQMVLEATKGHNYFIARLGMNEISSLVFSQSCTLLHFCIPSKWLRLEHNGQLLAIGT